MNGFKKFMELIVQIRYEGTMYRLDMKELCIDQI